MVMTYRKKNQILFNLQNKDSPAHTSASRSPGIFNEELQSKIEENAKLHKMVRYYRLM